jgi:GTP-binding protein
MVMADIPGIIEGAHEGKGLGLKFLRHVERTRVLAYLIPINVEDAQAEYELLRSELAEYSRELAEKPHCIVISKVDLLGPDQEVPRVSAPGAFASFAVSGVAQTGTQELAEGLWSVVQRERAEDEGADWKEHQRG